MLLSRSDSSRQPSTLSRRTDLTPVSSVADPDSLSRSSTVRRRSRPGGQEAIEMPCLGLRSNLQHLPPMFDVEDEGTLAYQTLWKHNRGKWARMIQVERLHLLLKDTTERLSVERPVQHEKQEQLVTYSRVANGLLQHLNEEAQETAKLQRFVQTAEVDLLEDPVIRTLRLTVERRTEEVHQLQASIDHRRLILDARKQKIRQVQEELDRLQNTSSAESPNNSRVTLAKYLPLAAPEVQPTDDAVEPQHYTRAIRKTDESSLSNQAKWVRMLQERNHEVLDSVFDETTARPVEHILSPQDKAYEAHRLEQKDMVTNIRSFSPMKKTDFYSGNDKTYDISDIVQYSTRLEKRIEKQRAVLNEATMDRNSDGLKQRKLRMNPSMVTL